MTALPQHLLDIVPNAVHVHSRANFPEHECQGEQSLLEIIDSAHSLGLTEVYLTEHTTNPGVGQPHHFDFGSQLGSDIYDHIAAVQLVAETNSFGLYPGLETNIMPNATIDAPPELTQVAALVIASMHGHVPTSGREVCFRMDVMRDLDVDMIGHPQRYVDVYDVDWDDVFILASDPDRPTLIEANFNAWFTYGPVKLLRKGDPDGAIDADRAERHFLQALGRSAAPVVVSLDIHNAGMWPTDAPEADWMPTFQHLEDYLDLLFSCGITQERIINNRLRDWLLLPKSDRGKLMSWL